MRWVCAIGRVGWREGIRLAGLSEVGGNERHVNSVS